MKKEIKIGSKIKLKYSQKYKNSILVVEQINNTHLIVRIKSFNNVDILKKLSLEEICLEEEDLCSEKFKKGDLVYCIINECNLSKGIIIEIYPRYAKVMIEGLKKIRISKKNILLINSNIKNKSEKPVI